jgi:hypothetical protein
MKVKTITYKKIFPTGLSQFYNEHIGVEVEVNEGEDVEELFKEAREVVHKMARESKAEMDKVAAAWDRHEEPILSTKSYIPKDFTLEDSVVSSAIKEEPIPVDEKVKGMKELLNLCTTKTLLERQRGQVERLNNPEVTEIFNNRLKSFE